MIEIELERTYLAKSLPSGLSTCPSRQIVDIYLPAEDPHPKLRLRKSGDTYAITKKVPLHGDDSSEQAEHTIALTEEEFVSLKKADGKRVEKKRYYYSYNGMALEIDVFENTLAGLVLVNVEFKNTEEKETFVMPDFCCAEVTQEKMFAGGVLAGTSYEDMASALEKFGYKKLFMA